MLYVKDEVYFGRLSNKIYYVKDWFIKQIEWGEIMRYKVSDIMPDNLSLENLKEIINIKLFRIIEIMGLNDVYK